MAFPHYLAMRLGSWVALRWAEICVSRCADENGVSLAVMAINSDTAFIVIATLPLASVSYSSHTLCIRGYTSFGLFGFDIERFLKEIDCVVG